MKFVDLEHPKTDGECSVPETTAENLVRHGGWRRVPDRTPPGRKPKPTPIKSSTTSPAPPPDPDIPGDGEEEPES